MNEQNKKILIEAEISRLKEQLTNDNLDIFDKRIITNTIKRLDKILKE